MLDFAQLKSGKFRKNNETFSIEAVINEIVKIFSFKAEQMAISIQS
jgi:signal transduction histidine kinase